MGTSSCCRGLWNVYVQFTFYGCQTCVFFRRGLSFCSLRLIFTFILEPCLCLGKYLLVQKLSASRSRARNTSPERGLRFRAPDPPLGSIGHPYSGGLGADRGGRVRSESKAKRRWICYTCTFWWHVFIFVC